MEARLLERGRELEAIDLALAQARGGRGSVLFVEGAPGIGKTALVRHAREVARETGMRTLLARGAELDRGLAFGVVRQLFAPLLRTGEGESLLTGPAAAALPALGLGSTDEPVDPAEVSFAVHWLLSDLADDGPLLLAVDDLQWADEASRRVIAHACSRLEDTGVAAVLAARPDAAVSVQFEPVLRDAGRELVLAPLSPEAVGEMAAGLSDGLDVDPGFAAACHEVSGGIPFFVGELVREVGDRGLGLSAQATAEVRELVPRAIQRSVLVRLARLTEDARRLARAVAVLPGPVPAGLAGAVAGVGADASNAAIGALIEAHVLRGADGLDFLHPIMRTAVHDDIPHGERAMLHRAAAERLHARGASPAAIAAHLLFVEPEGDIDTAGWLATAGAEALASGAATEAVRLLERALAEPPPAERRSQLLAALGRARGSAGVPGALEAFAEAHGSADGAAGRARVADDYAACLLLDARRSREAMQVLWQSVDELPERDERRLRLLAQIYVLSDRDLDALRKDQDRCLATIPRDLRGETPGERACLIALMDKDLTEGRLADQLAVVEPITGDAGRAFAAGEPPGSLMALYAIVCVIGTGRLTAGLDLAGHVLARARRSGRRSTLAHVMAQRSRALLRLGRVVEAEAEAGPAHELVRDGGSASERGLVAGWLGRILVERGKLDEAQDVLDGLELPAGDYARDAASGRAGPPGGRPWGPPGRRRALVAGEGGHRSSRCARPGQL